jgi:hypothetical protein
MEEEVTAFRLQFMINLIDSLAREERVRERKGMYLDPRQDVEEMPEDWE